LKTLVLLSEHLAGGLGVMNPRNKKKKKLALSARGSSRSSGAAPNRPRKPRRKGRRGGGRTVWARDYPLFKERATPWARKSYL